MASGALADSIASIELQNRAAEEVIPVVEPMLEAGDAISGQGFTIFLRSSPETLARVRSMIEVLDIPAKVLNVSVFQGSERDLAVLGVGASVQVDRGNASIDVGSGGSDDDAAGGSITYSTESGSAGIDAIRTQKSLQDNPIHQVRVTEGNEAYIETGERIPYFVGGWIGPRAAAGGIEYKDAITGFYVLPRIREDNVILEVSPFKNSRSDTGGGNIDTQSASTTVTGRVGEWLLIGGVTERVNREQNSIGRTIETQSQTSTGIWIKADLVQ